jgi:thioredoxin 1
MVNRTEFESEKDMNEKNGKGSPKSWHKLVVSLLVLMAVVAVVLIKSSKGPQVKQQRQTPRFSREEVLATVNGEPITLGNLEAEVEALPEEYRPEYSTRKHKLLEELITLKLLVQEAKRLEIAGSPAYEEELRGHDAHPSHEEEALRTALLKTQVFDQVRVSDEDIRGFYEKNKAELPPDLDFNANKEHLRDLALQKKQDEAMNTYISNLKQKAQITTNQRWVEAQIALAANNPLDKALKTGRPVVADFGRGTCIPCKMMKPILEDLAKEYRGKAEILIIQIDEYAFVTRRCGIRVIPTQIFYDSSANEVYRHQGFMPKEDIREQLAKLGVK